MKRIIFTSLLAVLVIAAVAFAEFFPTVIVTGINDKWVDTRAYTTLAAAVTAVGANERIIIVIGEEAVGTLTIPINVRLKFMSNGSLAVATQLTLQTYDIDAGDRQIFSGAGDIDFASGTVVRSTWFSDLDEALDVTSDDTLTMVIAESETLTANASVGAAVTLRWESPFIITDGGFTLDGLKKIEAGTYQIFSGAGDFDFLAGSVVHSSWFVRLRTADAYTADDAVDLTILVDQPETIDANTTFAAHQTLKVGKGCIITVETGDTLTINGPYIAGLYQTLAPVDIDAVTFGSKITVEAAWFGLVGDDTADDYTALQAAITAGVGLKVHIPNPASKYRITDELDIASANTIVYGDSDSDTIIRQATWGQPVFEVKGADGAKVSNFYLQSTEAKAVIGGVLDGCAARDYCAGIYVANSDNVEIDSVKVDGFVNGFRLRGRTADVTLSIGNKINNFFCTGVDQGVLIEQQEQYRITNGRITAIDNSQAVAVHGIYHTGGASSTYCLNGIIDNITMDDSDTDDGDDCAFLFKYVKGLLASNLSAIDCCSLISLDYVEDSVITDLIGRNLSPEINTDAGMINMQGNTCIANTISNVFISTAINQTSFLLVLDTGADSTDNIFKDMIFRDGSGHNDALITLRGTRNSIEDIYLYCSATARQVFVIDNATECLIKDFRSQNAEGTIFNIAATSTSLRLEYNSDLIDFAGGSGLLYFDAGTTTMILDKSTNIYTLANNVTPQVDVGNIFLTGGVIAITDFDSGYTGKQIRIISEHGITITDGASIILNGGANFNMVATDTLSLICKADNSWYETSRSVN